MLAFYMDRQFRARVSVGLRLRKIDVVTAIEDGAEELADDLLLARASALGRVLVTHDQDFLRIAAEWQTTGRDFAGVVFAVQQSFDIGIAIEFLELIAHVMPPDEIRNRVEFIPSRS
jgi:predicted nuclease of predicted toxin-antitoxin system